MKARASLAAAGARRWSAILITCSNRACFCSWLGKCMAGVRAIRKPPLSSKAGNAILRQQAAIHALLAVPSGRAQRKLQPAGGFSMIRITKAAIAALALAFVAIPATAQELAGTLKKI